MITERQVLLALALGWDHGVYYPTESFNKIPANNDRTGISTVRHAERAKTMCACTCCTPSHASSKTELVWPGIDGMYLDDISEFRQGKSFRVT